MRKWMGILSWDGFNGCAAPRSVPKVYAYQTVTETPSGGKPISLRVRTPDGTVFGYDGEAPAPGRFVRAVLMAGHKVGKSVYRGKV